MRLLNLYGILIAAIMLSFTSISCNQRVKEYYKDKPDRDPGIDLTITVQSLDSVTFTMVNNLKDTIMAPSVGNNTSRLFFLLGEEQNEVEWNISTSYGRGRTAAPGELIIWNENVNKIIEYLGIDTANIIDMYWKMEDFRSDTIKLK